jgi:AcrR family transcriptional regulator
VLRRGSLANRKGNARKNTRDKSADDEKFLSRRQLQAEQTRAELLKTARELFAKRGYSALGMEEIAHAAHATKGAIYHHFADKLTLFREVYEIEQVALVDRIEQAVASIPDPWARVLTAARTFIDALTDEAPRRIIFVDAPSALGWQKWRELHSRFALGATRKLVRDATAAGILEPLPLEPLAQMILGLCDSSSMFLADAPNQARARSAVERTFLRILEGLRTTAGTT